MRAKLISRGSLTFITNAGVFVTMQHGEIREDIPLCIFEGNRDWLEELPPAAPLAAAPLPNTELKDLRQTTQLKRRHAHRRGLDTGRDLEG